MQNLLNQPLVLKNGITIKNRLLKASMSEQLAINNKPSQTLINLYKIWANGGAGVLITGNVMVDKSALGAKDDVVLENDADLELFKAWAKAAKQNDTRVIMQLNHPGKQSPKFLSKTPVAPSALPLSNGLEKLFNTPRELSIDEIKQIIKRFANSAKLAKIAGFDGVQIHAAHGYLISQFLSALHNQRSDEYGGSLENRMRFLTQIYQAIKDEVKDDFIVCLKLNSADFQKGGFSEDESLKVAKTMADLGVDFIEISGGNYEAPAMLEGTKDSTKKREAYFLDYARKFRQICDTALVITGGFRSQKAINNALNNGELDIAGVAKPFALDRDFALKILNDPEFNLQINEPKFGIKKLDDMLFSAVIMYWYMEQMKRLSQNLDPNPKLSLWRVLFSSIYQNGLNTIKKVRA
ncbi:NADH:flavin oxidoreductase/NADH oxidase family protein [Campylobacter mucosalis]|uniref:Old yellow enzyme (OYE)-related FMN binding domain-containing protein n=1 Tax=Campylobacter mucosalis CCUG 21559 TaxID=1032067 RepID=A0A6G5QIT9_9BACT|nr:NADH:flavin oxidoreductase/NADH oxidase family protein [Campylobacter mucosalis]QCD45497.1 old yellow enzyme (OYE)-related FMN binding domain-containing protein [Campylobacter mucosalis CCUG 21559]